MDFLAISYEILMEIHGNSIYIIVYPERKKFGGKKFGGEKVLEGKSLEGKSLEGKCFGGKKFGGKNPGGRSHYSAIPFISLRKFWRE